jgi:predicted  nucleic acid-binding Zn-ribbon protein
MPYSDRVLYRNNRTGRFRRARGYEKNRHFRIDTLSQGVANFAFKTADRMDELAQELADEMVEWAQANAPWSDRSGAAREGLVAEVVSNNGSLEINLMHTVDYGIWLEVRWGGRYAIIIPTIEKFAIKMLNKMDNMLSEIEYP